MKLLVAICLGILVFLYPGAGPAGAASSPPLPLSVPDRQWRPLNQTWNRGLQRELDQALQQRELWRSLLGAGKMAVGLVDLSNPAAPRFAQANGGTMMYGASLPKLAILLAACQGFEDGTLKETPQVKADLMDMIRRSDNAAAGRLTARLGLEKIEALLTAPRYRFYDAAAGGGIWLGSGYTSGGEHRPEPLQGLLHAATANQVCRFYYLLAYGRLLSPARSRQMLEILSNPELHDKFVQVLEPAVPGPQLYRKSGEWRKWHLDSILVWGEPWRRYILVGLVEHEQGERILKEMVPVVEGLLRPKPHLPQPEPRALAPTPR
ncbi:MAG: serine hydrolase [Desulfobaccales bacterium]